jgi:hypothetical protein
MNENRERTVGNGNLKPFKPGQSGNPLGRPIGAKTGSRARINRLLDKEASPNILYSEILGYGVIFLGKLA